MTSDGLTAGLREVAEAATPGPWFYNSYSAVFSEPMSAKYDEFWTDERESDGHTYDHRVGEICPACGERPAIYGDTAKPEVRGQRFGTYWDCAFHKDAYDVEPVVASTPSQMGDTATGRHAADAKYIATFDPPTVLGLLDTIDRLARSSDGLREQIRDTLRPHWRTDCSTTEFQGGYARWVKCRCGWESEPSGERVNAPDMHEIWNAHLADAVLAAIEEGNR